MCMASPGPCAAPCKHQLRGARGHVLLCCELNRGPPSLGFVLAGQNVRKLVKDGFVIRKPTKIHSRSRALMNAEAKAKGRHTGYGACQDEPRPQQQPAERREAAGCSASSPWSGGPAAAPAMHSEG